MDNTKQEELNKIEGIVDARFGGDFTAAVQFVELVKSYARAEVTSVLEELEKMQLSEFENGQDDFTYYEVSTVQSNIQSIKEKYRG